MNKEKLKQLINDLLESVDEDVRNEVYDVYYQPNEEHVYLVVSGMAYDGNDKEAYEVAQVENQEVIHLYV